MMGALFYQMEKRKEEKGSKYASLRPRISCLGDVDSGWKTFHQWLQRDYDRRVPPEILRLAGDLGGSVILWQVWCSTSCHGQGEESLPWQVSV